jgi:large subunit ribosomal protein L5e
MPFVKIQKNNTYSKRFQVKFRRRRIGKTDYYQRKRLILQRKNKYNTPKWRFVVRRTNQRIICQVVWSTLKGDKVKAYADSFELKKYGITAGLTNYAAAYATGLLTARRLLTILDEENKKRDIKTSLAETFNLVKEATGEDTNIAELADKKGIETRPFTCYLDLGLVRATKGNRVFAAMKGALDGGINIPHKDTIFPGFGEEKDAKDKKKSKDSPLRDRIFGVHVQKYMEQYGKDKDKQEYQFSQWKKCLSAAGVKTIEDLYKKAHAEIRKNPAKTGKVTKPKYTRDKADKNIVVAPDGKKFRRDVRLTNAQRKERVNEKIKQFIESRKQ